MTLEVVTDAPNSANLGSFFSRGFTSRLESGFQSPDELEKRLDRISSVGEQFDDDPARLESLMTNADEEFKQAHRPTQIGILKNWGKQVHEHINGNILAITKKVKAPYAAEIAWPGNDSKMPGGVTFLYRMNLVVNIPSDPQINRRLLSYYIRFRGTEMVVFGGFATVSNSDGIGILSLNDIDEIHQFDGIDGTHPHLEKITVGAQSKVTDFIEELRSDALG